MAWLVEGEGANLGKGVLANVYKERFLTPNAGNPY